MSDAINLTVTEEIEVFNLSITEEPSILVNFFEVALPDPRVAEARSEAETSANAASDSATVATAAAEQAQEIANGIDQQIETAINEAFTNKSTDDLGEGIENLYFTDSRAKEAAVINSTDGAETDQAPSVSAMKDYVANNAPSLTSGNSAEVVYVKGNATTDGSWRFKTEVSGSMVLEVRIATVWTVKARYNI